MAPSGTLGATGSVERQLILLRHGESVWNQENRFTGWTDVDLAAKGLSEAKAAGQTLKLAGFRFDVCFTSVLRRAIRTAWLSLEELDQMWIPVEPDWRLNERHYGALQGLNKSETAAKHGEAQVKIWRRSYDVPPPPLALDDPRHPKLDPRYAGIPANELPVGEALKDTVARVVPVWEQRIAPAIRAGKSVLVVAHGNSIRALIKHLEDTPNDELLETNIPTGIPLLYQLKADLQPIRRTYLGDADAIAKAMHSVAGQGQAKGKGGSHGV